MLLFPSRSLVYAKAFPLKSELTVDPECPLYYQYTALLFQVS